MPQSLKPLAKVWSFLKSKKLAVLLISIITIAVTIDVFILASKWEPASPAPTNLGQRYGSLWFQALVIALLLNLTTCTIDSVWRRINNGNRNFYLWGSTIFHSGLIIILIGTLMTGNMRLFATIMLIQNEPKVIPYTGFIQDKFSWNDEPKITFLLEDQDIDLNDDGTAQEIFSHIMFSERGSTPVQSVLAVEEQVTYRGLYLYPGKCGYAVRLTLTGPVEGTAPTNVSLPLETQDFQSGVKAFSLNSYRDKQLPFALSLNLYPDLGTSDTTFQVNKSYQLNNPALYIQAYDTNKVISQQLVRPGETFKVDGYSIKFGKAIPWTQLTAVYDPGAKIVFWGIIIAISGLTLLFVLAGPRVFGKSPEEAPSS